MCYYMSLTMPKINYRMLVPADQYTPGCGWEEELRKVSFLPIEVFLECEQLRNHTHQQDIVDSFSVKVRLATKLATNGRVALHRLN